MMSTALFGKIASASASNGGNYIKDGRYLFTVTKVICENKFTGNCFIAEFRVDEATPAENGIAPNAVGTTCSMVANLDKHLSAASNVKAFVLGLMGYEESQVSPDEFVKVLEAITSDAQPARGRQVRDETFRKKSKAGKDLILNRWVSVPDQTKEQIAERRKTLDQDA